MRAFQSSPLGPAFQLLDVFAFLIRGESASMSVNESHRNLGGIALAFTLAAFVCSPAAFSISNPTRSVADAKLPPGSTLLTGAGATFPSLLYNRWVTVYHD